MKKGIVQEGIGFDNRYKGWKNTGLFYQGSEFGDLLTIKVLYQFISFNLSLFISRLFCSINYPNT